MTIVKKLPIITTILPPLYTALLCLVLPLFLTVYFWILRYREAFTSSENFDYFATQQDFLGRLLISEKLASALDTFINFAFWGVLAAIVLVVVWLVSAARVTIANHGAVGQFRNFRVSKSDWHGKFAVTATLKIIILGFIVYCIISILVKAIPGVSVTVSHFISQSDFGKGLQLILANGRLFLLQIGVIVAIRIYRRIEIE